MTLHWHPVCFSSTVLSNPSIIAASQDAIRDYDAMYTCWHTFLCLPKIGLNISHLCTLFFDVLSFHAFYHFFALSLPVLMSFTSFFSMLLLEVNTIIGKKTMKRDTTSKSFALGILHTKSFWHFLLLYNYTWPSIFLRVLYRYDHSWMIYLFLQVF